MLPPFLLVRTFLLALTSKRDPSSARQIRPRLCRDDTVNRSKTRQIPKQDEAKQEPKQNPKNPDAKSGFRRKKLGLGVALRRLNHFLEVKAEFFEYFFGVAIVRLGGGYNAFES
jgi:hypothetical protein